MAPCKTLVLSSADAKVDALSWVILDSDDEHVEGDALERKLGHKARPVNPNAAACCRLVCRERVGMGGEVEKARATIKGKFLLVDEEPN
jgi:hypothetical protein